MTYPPRHPIPVLFPPLTHPYSASSLSYDDADPVLNPPPPPLADPQGRPVTPEGSIHRIGTSSFVFVRATSPGTPGPASRERGEVGSSSESPKMTDEGQHSQQRTDTLELT